MNTNSNTTEAATTTEQKQRKPDFYDHVLSEEKDPADAAKIFAAMNRRKDFALRMIREHLRRGRRIEDTLSHAFNIAFPKGRDAKNFTA